MSEPRPLSPSRVAFAIVGLQDIDVTGRAERRKKRKTNRCASPNEPSFSLFFSSASLGSLHHSPPSPSTPNLCAPPSPPRPTPSPIARLSTAPLRQLHGVRAHPMMRPKPASSLQKTYDDCYLMCSTAVYFEGQVGRLSLARSPSSMSMTAY